MTSRIFKLFIIEGGKKNKYYGKGKKGKGRKRNPGMD